MHEKLVEISHLSYFYPLDRKRVFQAVKDVSFEIRRDEIFGLVGESGSGKSTVGKCLMGILSPEADTFSYDGINLLDKKAKKKNARRLQKERQMIFQDSTSSLNQKMKVEKILAEPLEIHKVFSDKKIIIVKDDIKPKRNEDGTIRRVMPNLESSADIYNSFLELGFDGINPRGQSA